MTYQPDYTIPDDLKEEIIAGGLDTGIENLLPIRTAIMSQPFDHMWNAAYNLPPN